MRKKPLVYLVEDDCVLAKIITWDLQEKLTCVVKTFVTGEEMITQLKYESPNIVLLDYFLPGMNGLEVFEVIKSELPETPVVGVSGQLQLKEVQEFFNTNLYAAIEKDTDFIQQIRKKVETIISETQEEEIVVEFDDSLDKKIVFSGVLGLMIILAVIYYSFLDVL